LILPQFTSRCSRYNVPLGEFYAAILQAAFRAKYVGLLTALVRDADAARFYEDISRYWDLLHDLTGPDILFVLAGSSASTKVGDRGVPDGRELVAYHLLGIPDGLYWSKAISEHMDVFIRTTIQGRKD